MNRLITGIMLCYIIQLAEAQSLPDISYKDHGYNKPVKQVEQVYYSFESDSIEKVEKTIRKFNADGNMGSFENQSFLDDSWTKSKTTYIKGQILKEVWEHSNPYLNRTSTFEYDVKGRMIKENIKFQDGALSFIKYAYKDDRLYQIASTIDGVRSVTERYYSKKGVLYKEIHRQKVPNDSDIITNYYYLNEKEIGSYVLPRNYFYKSIYLNDQVEIKFKLVENTATLDAFYESLSQFEREARNDQQSLSLQTYAEQTLLKFKENNLHIKPYSILLYYRGEKNSAGDILAEAEVDPLTNTLFGIGFFKITYTDKTVVGSTDYNMNMRRYFEKVLNELQLPQTYGR